MKNRINKTGFVATLILTVAVMASVLIANADDVRRYRYKFIGTTGNYAAFGSLTSGDVVTATEVEAGLMTDRSVWIPIDRTVAPNPLVSAGGAATLGNYSQLYLLNVTTSVVVLPSVSHGREVILKLQNVNTGEVWVATAGQKIDGATNLLVGPSNAVYRLLSDGTNWWQSN